MSTQKTVLAVADQEFGPERVGERETARESCTNDLCVCYCDSFLIAPFALDHKVKI